MQLLIAILIFVPLVSTAQLDTRKNKKIFGPYSMQPQFLHGNKILDTIYYPDKKIKAIGFYAVDDEGKKTYYRTALWTEYYNNGEIKSRGSYLFNFIYGCCGGLPCVHSNVYKVGDWIYYYENAVVKAKGIYKVERIEVSTGVENQFAYKSVYTDAWNFYDPDGQIAKDRQKIISELEKPTAL